MRPTSPTPPLVELRKITKRYGDLLANDHIDLSIERGEVHALLGENGAGKSTLVKILYGVVEPNAGEILCDGQPVAITSPVDARALGLGMVFQHFSLFDELTVAENIAVALSREGSLASVRAKLQEVSRNYGLALEPDRAVWTLSAGERQRIEIVRCLLQNPKLLILDEPTSVLTPQESEHLFTTLDKLAEEGCAILYISHKLEEVRRLCRRATILRGGRVVATLDPRERSAREIAALMVGSEVGEVRAGATPAAAQASALLVKDLSVPPAGLHGKEPRKASTLPPVSAKSSGLPASRGTGRANSLPSFPASALRNHRKRSGFAAARALVPASRPGGGSAQRSCRKNASGTPLLQPIASARIR